MATSTKFIKRRCSDCGMPLAVKFDDAGEPRREQGDVVATCINRRCVSFKDYVYIDPSEVPT